MRTSLAPSAWTSSPAPSSAAAATGAGAARRSRPSHRTVLRFDNRQVSLPADVARTPHGCRCSMLVEDNVVKAFNSADDGGMEWCASAAEPRARGGRAAELLCLLLLVQLARGC